jgi:hypothetical protein
MEIRDWRFVVAKRISGLEALAGLLAVKDLKLVGIFIC